MIHILRVYGRYYWGKLLGRRMRLYGRPGTARFKCLEANAPKITKAEFEEYVKGTAGVEEFAKMEIVPCACQGKHGEFVWKNQTIACPGWRSQYKRTPFNPSLYKDKSDGVSKTDV